MGKELEGERIILHPLEPSLFDCYLAHYSETVQKMLGVKTLEEERNYLQMHYQKMQEGSVHFFCIFLKEANELIGALEIRPETYRGNFYGWLHENFWSKGLFQEALHVLIPYYFSKNPSQTSLTAFIDFSNKRSIETFERAGFTKFCKRKGPREDQWELKYEVIKPY